MLSGGRVSLRRRDHSFCFVSERHSSYFIGLDSVIICFSFSVVLRLQKAQGLTGTGSPQQGNLDFHTAPELLIIFFKKEKEKEAYNACVESTQLISARKMSHEHNNKVRKMGMALLNWTACIL